MSENIEYTELVRMIVFSVIEASDPKLAGLYRQYMEELSR